MRVGARAHSGWLMMLSALTVGVMLSTSGAAAAPEGQGGATVTRWAEGLAGPQGLARDGAGQILVVENQTGKVRRFSPDGKEAASFAAGLNAPAWALFLDGALYVSERKGNTVARIDKSGTVSRLQGEVVDPLGLAADPKQPGSLLVISHRQSVVHRFAPEGGQGTLVRQSEPAAATSGPQYGWRDLAVAADGTLYVTDELSGAILRRRPGGEFQPWVTSLASPSGLALSPGGELFVTEEGNGRVSRLSGAGAVTVVAQGLGKARAVLFLDRRTLLISDREGGVIWKVTLLPA